jgi:protein-histidine pros-kinase
VKPLSPTGEFLANLSHDLRTPLNGIIGFTVLIREGKLGPVSDDQKECLGDVLTSAQQMVSLISEVSDLGKIESGTLELRPEAIDLGSVVNAVQNAVAPLATQKHVSIAPTIDARLTGITADPGRLQQIVAIWVSQAVKATPEGGRVAVRVTAEDTRRFRVEVEDGGGQPLSLDGSAGLSLTLSRRIVELLGGRLGVRSQAGAGNVIFAVLPRTPEVARGG